jgi:hypothetical protein
LSLEITAAELAGKMRSPNPPLALAVFRVEAGDLVYVMPPSGKNLLVDCGYYTDPAIDRTLLGLPGKLSQIVITHQHLDHFASLARVVRNHGLEPSQVAHSGFRLPENALPEGELSSCSSYRGMEPSLFFQYQAYVRDDHRWERVDLGDGLWAHNLRPAKSGLLDKELSYDMLNLVSTPISISYGGNDIVFASDTPPPAMDKLTNLRSPSLYFAASHGHPEYNPEALLHRIAPRRVCITDSFPDTDFVPYFREALPEADVRALNQVGPTVYLFEADGQTSTRSLRLS